MFCSTSVSRTLNKLDNLYPLDEVPRHSLFDGEIALNALLANVLIEYIGLFPSFALPLPDGNAL